MRSFGAGTKTSVILAKSRPLIAATALGIGCFYVVQSVVMERMAKAEVLVAPFTLERDGYSYESDPAGQITLHTTEARRSDGASALVEDIMPGSPGEHSARRVTFMDGNVVTLVDALGVKSTWPRMPADLLAQRKAFSLNPPQNCVAPGETLVGYGQVSGRRVSIVREVQAATTETTAWKDSELGCSSLQLRAERLEPDGNRKVVAESRLVRLALEEPDPSLFDTRTDYTEMKPSERLRKQTQHDGVAWDENLQHQAEQMDRSYLGTDRP